MKNNRLVLTGAVIAVLLFSVFAIPMNANSNNFVEVMQNELAKIDINAFTPTVGTAKATDLDCNDADNPNAPCHEITMEAVEMPDGLFAYRMKEHLFDPDGANGASGFTILTGKYSSKASIPGPTIVLREKQEAFVTLDNLVKCDSFPDEIDAARETPSISRIGIHVHGVHYDILSDGTPRSINMVADEAAECDDSSGLGHFTYHWVAAEGTRGTWPYHDHTFLSEVGGEGRGLFGTVIVNPNESAVTKAIVDGVIKQVTLGEIKKEFILWMTSTEHLGKSVFYGMEIDNENGEKQTPLWINPILVATEGDIVRFHVLGMGDEFHAFHLHAHRWVEPTTEHIVDTVEIEPLIHHVFALKAGEGVGDGDWMYHCHVLRHMEEGMSGIFKVLPAGTDDTLPPVGAVFTLTDEPGRWFKTIDKGILDAVDPRDGIGFPLDFIGSDTRSLALISPGETVMFNMKDSVTLHTITTLIWPEGATRGADSFPMDNRLMLRGSTFMTDNAGKPVPLTTEGLYVFVCQIHPYMFGAVIVDDDPIEGSDVVLDLGDTLKILTRTAAIPDVTDPASTIPALSITTAPSLSALPPALLKTFFIITDPTNWKDYTDPDGFWDVRVPGTGAVPVFVKGSDGVSTLTVNLDVLESSTPLESTDAGLPSKAIGEVLVNTQFELTLNKMESKRESLKAADASPLAKPGTITVVDKNGIDSKIALPGISMNHPHNMWADQDEEVIYQTQWFDRRLVAIDRATGEVIKDIVVGQSPSHVVTSPTTDKLYIAMNGEEQVLEIDPVTLKPTRQISTGIDSHPHGHWLSSDGKFIVTPNFAFPGDSTIVDISTDPPTIEKRKTGESPIATGMRPQGDKYYTADFLGNSLTCISVDLSSPACGTGPSAYKRIDLLTVGAGLPIQTPVSPDGKWVVTADTLFSKITVVDTSTDEVVAAIDCDPGCHGVNFGKKSGGGGGYYAYVTNKFSNAMIVVDPNALTDSDPTTDDSNIIVSRILLVDSSSADKDDRIIGNKGMGGQGVLPLPFAYPGWD